MRRRATLLPVVGLIAVLSAACGAGSRGATTAAHRHVAGATRTTSTTAAQTTTSSTAPHAPTVASPPTTGPPPFSGTITTVTAADLPSTWRPGCPVDPSQLRMLHMSYWGFDGQPHAGTMVVNASVASAVLEVFSTLYGERFPIRKMQPVDAYGGSDPASTADDDTAGFNCRYAVAPGPPSWSVHAYGEAIDVNPVENPYVEGGTVQPPDGAPYTDRADVRPGMAVPGGQLNAAFAAVGWQWGGRWADTPDYQHFSLNGD